MGRLFGYLLGVLLYVGLTFAAFGVTTSGTNMLVDSGAGLVTTSTYRLPSFLAALNLALVNTSNGDIISLKFNGLELQDQSKFTQLSSGLGSATVTSSVANSIATITIKTSTIVSISPAYYLLQSL